MAIKRRIIKKSVANKKPIIKESEPLDLVPNISGVFSMLPDSNQVLSSFSAKQFLYLQICSMLADVDGIAVSLFFAEDAHQAFGEFYDYDTIIDVYSELEKEGLIVLTEDYIEVGEFSVDGILFFDSKVSSPPPTPPKNPTSSGSKSKIGIGSTPKISRPTKKDKASSQLGNGEAVKYAHMLAKYNTYCKDFQGSLPQSRKSLPLELHNNIYHSYRNQSNTVKDLILFYNSAYQLVYKELSSRKFTGKEAGLMKRLVSTYSPDILRTMLLIFFDDVDRWWSGAAPNIITFNHCKDKLYLETLGKTNKAKSLNKNVDTYAESEY